MRAYDTINSTNSYSSFSLEPSSGYGIAKLNAHNIYIVPKSSISGASHGTIYLGDSNVSGTIDLKASTIKLGNSYLGFYNTTATSRKTITAQSWDGSSTAVADLRSDINSLFELLSDIFDAIGDNSGGNGLIHLDW